jgi:hypothetical protein
MELEIEKRSMKRILVMCIILLIGALLASIYFPHFDIPFGEKKIGFAFAGHPSGEPWGDRTAATHLFVHGYPFPEDAVVKGVVLRNDKEETDGERSEAITLVILRPETAGWRVINAVDLDVDDLPARTTGTTYLKFDKPLEVKKGDLFGHFQNVEMPGGPIPLNLDAASIEGKSSGKAGFSRYDILPGKLIPNEGFTGRRDYYINVVFKTN